jgi:hypothetical protein
VHGELWHPRILGRLSNSWLAVQATLLSGLLVGAILLGGCGNTLQDRPVASNLLEQLVELREYPIYWLGAEFRHLSVTGVLRDPSEAFTLQYGDCIEGGQSTCVPPLALVSSPNNSFQPIGSVPARRVAIRGVSGWLTRGGRTIEIPTAGVVVDIYAKTPKLAMAAARMMVAINQSGAPGAALPAAIGNTAFDNQPVSGQLPSASAH